MMVIDRTKGDECMKKRMIVFGGTGVFGQAFIPLALAQGYQVTSVSPSGTPKEFATWQSEELNIANYVNGDFVVSSLFLFICNPNVPHSDQSTGMAEEPLEEHNIVVALVMKVSKRFP